MTSSAKSPLLGLESPVLDGSKDSPATSDTMDVESASTSPLTVRLVVGYGSHAGVAANILVGIYMIGRHGECQIRPKSHSVSRRHCLVQHLRGVVRVFDLESKRGTYVNDVRLAPKKWHLLNHGDRLRCGSYWFNVAIYDEELDAELDLVVAAKGKNLVAGYSDVKVGDDEVDDADDVADADIFAEENFGTNGGSDLGLEVDAAPTTDPDAGRQAQEALPEGTSKKAKSQPSRLPKPKISNNYRKSSSGSSFSFSFSSPDSLKMVLAILAMLTVVAFLGWTVYKIQSGPPVKILRGID